MPPLDESDAEALFTARAEALDAAFAPDTAMREVCRELDGLPLAIELAAARTSIFTTTQLKARLSKRLDEFVGDRDVEPRQRTLRATIEWSHELLPDPERRLFRRLAVFAGGFSFEAAEHVADADATGLSRFSTRASSGDATRSTVPATRCSRRRSATTPRRCSMQAARVTASAIVTSIWFSISQSRPSRS